MDKLECSEDDIELDEIYDEFGLCICNNTEVSKLAAVKRYGPNIKYLYNPSKEIAFAAVTQNGNALQYIKNPSKEIQLAAVKQNGFSIQYISYPSEEVQLAAVKQCGEAIQCIKNPSKDVQLAAVKQNGNIIYYITNASKEVQLASLWIFEARKYGTYGLNLPTIYYKWIHDYPEKYFEKNLKNRTKKYSDINIRC